MIHRIGSDPTLSTNIWTRPDHPTQLMDEHPTRVQHWQILRRKLTW